MSVDTSLDAKLTACPREVPIQFETRFFYQTRDRLSESHMWLSILYRPQFSQFTRVERASCALVYIFLTMIANAMYFNPNPEYVSPPLVQVGPLRFTPQQVTFISSKPKQKQTNKNAIKKNQQQEKQKQIKSNKKVCKI